METIPDSGPKLQAEHVIELRNANLRCVEWTDVIELTRETDPVQRHAMKCYFRQFVFTRDWACPLCASALSGHAGTFVAHPEIPGEGQCRTCGWPCRTAHCLEGVPEKIPSRPLPYHPDAIALVSEAVAWERAEAAKEEAA